LLNSLMMDINDIQGIAVSQGPGSFTGIRIGISAAKGLAFANNLPCVGVSTLRALAENFKTTDCYVCAVMDARCNQVYNALFEIKSGKIIRICDDRALMCNDLASEIEYLAQHGKEIIVCGDGTDLFFKFVSHLANVKSADELVKFQNAIGVGLSSLEDFFYGNTTTSEQLIPVYLRLPQAQRELNEKFKLEE
ncbi:MAG: tRNA (adenosine(37)-N6)-threonylcarbamoyltransferase complex dimerization subunit type 1 TsaB, partial [Clostridia bacterium]|nr:tRNA (adenosine(37)-N6)-threonylcarbamoyltransferase complex dimerization subunit type 1 TsaB [Clostridia bacterium]